MNDIAKKTTKESMKFKNLRTIALIIASVIIIYFAGIFIIIAAHFVQELTDGDSEPLFQFLDVYMSIFLFLSIVSVIIAWFKNYVGGILVTASAIALIFSNLNDLHLGRWPQYILLFSGILLLFFVRYNKWLLKREQTSEVKQ